MIIQPKYLLLSLLLLPFLTGCDVVNGNGHVSKEERTIEAFTELDVQGSMDVTVSKGNSTSARIEAEDNLLEYIELHSEGNKLKVKFRDNSSIRSHKPIRVHITTNTLEEANMSGSGNLTLDGLFTSEQKIGLSVSGSGNIRGNINAPEVDINVSGSGNITLKGETRDVDIDVAGSGNCRVDELLAETAKINIAGSGDVRVYASRSLKANLVGSGSVRYKGEPSIDLNKIGSGNVRKL